MIGAHTDKQSSSNGSNEANAIHMSEKQEKILVRVCNDRVRLAIHRMKAPDDAAEDDEHHQIAVDRTKKMVETIRDFMGPEVCAPLAMEHFFQQAGTISRGPLSEVFKVSLWRKQKQSNILIGAVFWGRKDSTAERRDDDLLEGRVLFLVKSTPLAIHRCRLTAFSTLPFRVILRCFPSG